MDYYAYELGRLRHIADATIKVFERAAKAKPHSLVDALHNFDAAIPKLKDIRDPVTHPNNDNKLDQVAWFSSIVNLHPDGSVEYLVDPEYHQHDAALALARALTAHCRQVMLAQLRPTHPGPETKPADSEP